jgi:hypothetical protein
MTRSILIINTPKNCSTCPAGTAAFGQCKKAKYDADTPPGECPATEYPPEVADFLEKLQSDFRTIEETRARAKTAEDRERVLWAIIDWLCNHRGLDCPPTIKAGDVDCTTINCDQCWALEAAKAVAAIIERRRQK